MYEFISLASTEGLYRLHKALKEDRVLRRKYAVDYQGKTLAQSNPYAMIDCACPVVLARNCKQLVEAHQINFLHGENIFIHLWDWHKITNDELLQVVEKEMHHRGLGSSPPPQEETLTKEEVQILFESPKNYPTIPVNTLPSKRDMLLSEPLRTWDQVRKFSPALYALHMRLDMSPCCHLSLLECCCDSTSKEMDRIIAEETS